MSARMNARVYTLAEARAVLPKVKELMHAIQTARRDILRLQPQLWPVLRGAAGNGGSREAGAALQPFARLDAGVRGILSLGILVKDIDKGLVDFLGKRNDREIFLCWHYGEDDILFWHELDAGFAGRQPVDGEII